MGLICKCKIKYEKRLASHFGMEYTLLGNNAYRVGAWRSLVARLLWEQNVACSNHVAPTIANKGPIEIFL